jgi:predicted peptidase
VPLILFLHGSGESGLDGWEKDQKVRHVALGKAIRQATKPFPFLVVFPQAHNVKKGHAESWSQGTPDAKRAMAILAEVQQHYHVDAKRLYLTGWSMGGHGTWALATGHPHKWAAIVPVAGWGPGIRVENHESKKDVINPEAINKIKDIPCWIFHSAADRGVEVHHALDMYKALNLAQGKPRLHVFAKDMGVSHVETPDHVYPFPSPLGLYRWLLEHRKP